MLGIIAMFSQYNHLVSSGEMNCMEYLNWYEKILLKNLVKFNIEKIDSSNCLYFYQKFVNYHIRAMLLLVFYRTIKYVFTRPHEM